MLTKAPTQEGWLEISCKNTSPAQFIMKIIDTWNQKQLKYYHYAYKGGAV